MSGHGSPNIAELENYDRYSHSSSRRSAAERSALRLFDRARREKNFSVLHTKRHSSNLGTQFTLLAAIVLVLLCSQVVKTSAQNPQQQNLSPYQTNSLDNQELLRIVPREQPSNSENPAIPRLILDTAPPKPSAQNDPWQLPNLTQPGSQSGQPNDANANQPPALLSSASNQLAANKGDPLGWNVQLRVAWGGTVEQLWAGELRCSSGPVKFVRALGVEADEPASMQTTADGALMFSQRSMRTYDGVDIIVPYQADAKLTYRFQSLDGQPVTGELTITELMQKSWQRNLDERGNRLYVRRLPEDLLRVRMDRKSLVFAPQEKFKFEVTPHLLPTQDGKSIKLNIRMLAKSNGSEQWTHEFSIPSWSQNWSKPLQEGGTQPSITFETPIPAQEGVYDLVIEAVEKSPLRMGKTLVSRNVQLVVLTDRVAPLRPDVLIGWVKVQEIDPTNNSSLDKFKTNLLTWPGTKSGSFNNNLSNVVTLPELGKAIQLGTVDPKIAATLKTESEKPATDPKSIDPKSTASKIAPDVAWEAYHLSLNQPGMPHMIEVEYPANIPGALGISIVEPNAAGQVQPIGLDSGVIVPREATIESPKWAVHRLIVWPRTKTPVLLLTNRSENGAVHFGKIRVLAGPPHLTPLEQTRIWPNNERLVVATWQRPLFTKNFSANEQIDQWSGRTLDDWQTFYDGASRMIEYIRFAGFNAVSVPVLSEASTLYPSERLQPTPHFDTGIFFDSGNDPVRKDVLEMLLKMMDREKLKLFTTMQFASPLPELEEIVQRSEAAQLSVNGSNPTAVNMSAATEADGILLVGEYGLPWHKVNAPRRGLAPYYNPLDPRVQGAILSSIRELMDRTKKHPSFAGVNLELTAEGYLQFPGEMWGLDDRTMAAFEFETHKRILGEGAQRFTQRAAFLRTNQAMRQQWLEWRAAKLRQFYERIHDEVVRACSDARLVIAPTNAWDSPELVNDQLPSLMMRGNSVELRGKIGWGLGEQSTMRDVPWLRTWRELPPTPIVAAAMDSERNVDRAWNQWSTGSVIVGAMLTHEPQRLRLPSFDAKSPFGADKTSTWQVTQFTPSGAANRHRFTRALTQMDADWLFDGGWLLSMGQEESVSELYQAFRHLPVARFETIANETEPVVLRRLVRDGQTWFYAVNDSPWGATLSFEVNAPSGTQPRELSGLRKVGTVEGNNWNIELKPYDLLAVSFPGEVQFASPLITYPPKMRQQLDAELRELRQRRLSLENPQPNVSLANADLEQLDKNNLPTGWEFFARTTQSGLAQSDDRAPKLGQRSLRVTSFDPNGVTLQSPAFDATKTGRLAVSVYMRIEKPDQQPSIRLSVVGNWRDREYFRYATVGKDQQNYPLRSEWSQYVLQIDDLPAEGLSQLRFRVDVLGQGECSIDNVQLYDLVFNEPERRQLDKLFSLVEIQLEKNKLGRSWIDLHGYWPKYMRENVPLAQPVPMIAPPTNVTSDQPAAGGAPQRTVPEKQATKPTVKERVREWWRF